MQPRPIIVKRSVTVGGHKTSISLEAEFWNGLKEIAERQKLTVSALLRQIDSGREHANLSSAVRIFVLEDYRERAAAARRHQGGGVMPTFVFDDMPPTR